MCDAPVSQMTGPTPFVGTSLRTATCNSTAPVAPLVTRMNGSTAKRTRAEEGLFVVAVWANAPCPTASHPSAKSSQRESRNTEHATRRARDCS